MAKVSSMYTINPHMGKVRRLAVNDVLIRKLTYEEAGRKYGVTKSAICKWMKKRDPDHRVFIDTLPSRPKSHPNQIKKGVVEKVVYFRNKYGRCAPVIHEYLAREGVDISLASVGRILKREGLTRKKKAEWYEKVERPPSIAPGSLVETDTIHIVKADYSRFYIYSVIDTFSRFGYAQYQPKISQNISTSAILSAQNYFGFPFRVVQADNGPEFRNSFESTLQRKSIMVRHSRVRKPNDQAHVERFNRTIQEECFRGFPPRERTAKRLLEEYIHYYNFERLHLSLNLQTPNEFVSKVLI